MCKLTAPRWTGAPASTTPHQNVPSSSCARAATLRTNPLAEQHLADFIACYHPENRHQRHETERFRRFSYDDLQKRDKLSLDLFWLRDESLEGADALPAPDVLAQSIVEDLRAALEQFAAIAEDLGADPDEIELATADD